jgi:hypothetical protein
VRVSRALDHGRGRNSTITLKWIVADKELEVVALKEIAKGNW